jgi:hypothetical protein
MRPASGKCTYGSAAIAIRLTKIPSELVIHLYEESINGIAICMHGDGYHQREIRTDSASVPRPTTSSAAALLQGAPRQRREVAVSGHAGATTTGHHYSQHISGARRPEGSEALYPDSRGFEVCDHAGPGKMHGICGRPFSGRLSGSIVVHPRRLSPAAPTMRAALPPS